MEPRWPRDAIPYICIPYHTIPAGGGTLTRPTSSFLLPPTPQSLAFTAPRLLSFYHLHYLLNGGQFKSVKSFQNRELCRTWGVHCSTAVISAKLKQDWNRGKMQEMHFFRHQALSLSFSNEETLLRQKLRLSENTQGAALLHS